VLFCPNGISPRDPRAVLYFQDMFHFRIDGGATNLMRLVPRNVVRASWRRLSSDSAKLGICVSRHICEEVRKRVRLPSIVVYNGVDIGEATWSGEENCVFVLGGIGHRKDEQTAIRAWSTIPVAARRDVLLRIGGVEPASRRASLRALAATLGIGREVSVVGTLPRHMYLEEIAKARVVVSCSRMEAFSLPVAEAILMGAPVLCTTIASHLELIKETGAGASFATRDHAQLATAIGAALSGTAPPRLQVPLSGWSWDSRARQHIDAYVSRE